MIFILVFLGSLVAIFLSWIIIPVGIALVLGIVATMVAKELHDKKRIPTPREAYENQRNSRTR